MYSAQEQQVFPQICELPVDASLSELQSPSSPRCKLQESFPFLPSDYFNFMLACSRIFFSMSSFPNSSFSHQSPKHHKHTVLAEQGWTSSNLLSQLCLLSLTSSKGGGKDTKLLWPGPVLMSSLFMLFSTSNFRFPKVFLFSWVNITNRAVL